ncbi:MAG TPA: hypothetical protein VLF89_01140 [Candidatus Saccharimonadales bacterium]|nr:hypothetical protein [Candidatus Saccharimonadales bacterium]
MNIQSVKITIADLKSKYAEIESENVPLQFFTKISHYGKYILEDKACKHVLVKPLLEANQMDTQAFKKAWKEFYKEWNVYARDIIVQAEKAEIKDHPNSPVNNEVFIIKSYLDRSETSLYSSNVSDYFTNYWYLVRRFNDLGKSNFLIPMHFDTPESQMKIYPSYDKANDAWKKFEQSREIQVWWAHYQICRLSAVTLELNEKDDYFKSEDSVDSFYKYEFEELARGNISNTPIVLHFHKYKVWIKRLHEYLIPRLEVLEHTNFNDEANLYTKSKPTSFNIKTSKLEVMGKFITIPRNTDQFELCNAIFKNPQSKSREWLNSEFLTEWGGGYEQKDAWRKAYNAAREVNLKVASKTTIEDFLFIKPKTTQLNPHYI